MHLSEKLLMKILQNNVIKNFYFKIYQYLSSIFSFLVYIKLIMSLLEF